MPSLWKFGGMTPFRLAQAVVKQMGEDELSTRSAALSYYFVLAVFPLFLFYYRWSDFSRDNIPNCGTASSQAWERWRRDPRRS